MACISPHCHGDEDDEVRSFCDCPNQRWHKKCVIQKGIEAAMDKYEGLPTSDMQISTLVQSVVQGVISPNAVDLEVAIFSSYYNSLLRQTHESYWRDSSTLLVCPQCRKSLVDMEGNFFFVPNWKATIPFVVSDMLDFLTSRSNMIGLALFCAYIFCPELSLCSLLMIALWIPDRADWIAGILAYCCIISIVGEFVTNPESLVLALIPIVSWLWYKGFQTWLPMQYGIVSIGNQWVAHIHLANYPLAAEILKMCLTKI